MDTDKIFIGTSGFYYEGWMGRFYPEKLAKPNLLSYYQQHFPTVEINSSFYHIPREITVQNWKDTVTNNFIFSFKVSRIFTHLKKFKVDRNIVDTILQPLQILAEMPPKHLLFFQTPSFLKINVENLQCLLDLLPQSFLCTFEFRHMSWFTEEVYDVLRKYNASLVLSDSPIDRDGKRMWPYKDVDTADFAYIRFHGSQKLYVSSYTDEELESYADIINRKVHKGMRVYAYFNNDINGYAVENAKRLMGMLKI